MELVTIHKSVIGLDVHQARTACALIEMPDGSTRVEQRQFGGLLSSRTKWSWKARASIGKVLMQRLKPSRQGRQCAAWFQGKTDIGDAQWLAMLSRAATWIIHSTGCLKGVAADRSSTAKAGQPAHG
jgi:transposase